MFQSLNAGFIFTIAPLFAFLWIALAKRNIEPSTPVKFSIGIFFVELGFLALVYGMESSDGLQTGIIWIVLIYLLHTWRIMSITCWPIISNQTFPTKNCRIHDGYVVFCFCCGNFVAGEIAKATAIDDSGASADVYDLVQKQSFIDVYTNVGLMAVGVAFVLLLLSPSKFKITRNKVV